MEEIKHILPEQSSLADEVTNYAFCVINGGMIFFMRLQLKQF